jgi:tRNA1Val (adenine37-N6)-methyltransferase
MVAHKYPAAIDAVEIDGPAFHQMRENIDQSPWHERITCHHEDIRDFAKDSSIAYDFIITNPPFYQNQLKSPDVRINQARHATSLIRSELISLSLNMLGNQGMLSILLPIAQTRDVIRAARYYAIHSINQLIIYDRPGSPPLASVTIFSKTPRPYREESLYIKNAKNELTRAFCTLLRPYYLYL